MQSDGGAGGGSGNDTAFTMEVTPLEEYDPRAPRAGCGSSATTRGTSTGWSGEL